jgi:hypothetical protein
MSVKSAHPLQSLHLVLCSVGRLSAPRDKASWIKAHEIVCWLSCVLRVPLIDAGDVPIDRGIAQDLFWQVEAVCKALPLDDLSRVVEHLAELESVLPGALPAEKRVAKVSSVPSLRGVALCPA